MLGVLAPPEPFAVISSANMTELTYLTYICFISVLAHRNMSIKIETHSLFIFPISFFPEIGDKSQH